MIILRIPPLLRRQDLRHDLAAPPLLVRLLGDLPRHLFLLGGVVEDAAAVLRPPVRALLVGCCGVVHPVEEGQEVGVGEEGGVVD